MVKMVDREIMERKAPQVSSVKEDHADRPANKVRQEHKD